MESADGVREPKGYHMDHEDTGEKHTDRNLVLCCNKLNQKERNTEKVLVGDESTPRRERREKNL